MSTNYGPERVEKKPIPKPLYADGMTAYRCKKCNRVFDVYIIGYNLHIKDLPFSKGCVCGGELHRTLPHMDTPIPNEHLIMPDENYIEYIPSERYTIRKNFSFHIRNSGR